MTHTGADDDDEEGSTKPDLELCPDSELGKKHHMLRTGVRSNT